MTNNMIDIKQGAKKKRNKNFDKLKNYIIVILVMCIIFSVYTMVRDNRANSYRPNDGGSVASYNPGDTSGDVSQNVSEDLFYIENLQVASVDNGPLWTEVNFTFDFISSSRLDSFRDNTGLVALSAFVEYYKADGTVEISQTYGTSILGDNRYSAEIICHDTDLGPEDLISVVFDVSGFEGSHTHRVVFQP